MMSCWNIWSRPIWRSRAEIGDWRLTTAKRQIRELREQLHYWQMQAKMEARWLKQSRAKCKEIGAKMRKLQKGDKG